MAEKQFPPSELRLQRLRESGIIAFSRELSSFFLFLAFFGLIAAAVQFGTDRLRGLRKSFTQLVSTTASGSSIGFAPLDVAFTLCMSAAAIAALLALFVLFGGLLQNRFLWTAKALFRFEGLFSLEIFTQMPVRILIALLRILLATGLLFALSLLLYEGVHELLTPADQVYTGADTSTILRDMLSNELESLVFLFNRLFLGSILLLAGIAIVSRVVVVQRFLKKYSMTRQEVEAELRETEPSPEMRDRQRQQ